MRPLPKRRPVLKNGTRSKNICTEGLPGVLGNKETLAKYRRERGNVSLFLGNRGTKLYKLEDENIASKFIKRGTNKENVSEHGNIGQFWKGTREHESPWETLCTCYVKNLHQKACRTCSTIIFPHSTNRIIDL